jgi:hypothetical protein
MEKTTNNKTATRSQHNKCLFTNYVDEEEDKDEEEEKDKEEADEEYGGRGVEAPQQVRH